MAWSSNEARLSQCVQADGMSIDVSCLPPPPPRSTRCLWHQQPQHISKSGISTSTFKIFMSVEGVLESGL